jgi:hypothetical protein
LQLPARSAWPSCPTFRLTARGFVASAWTGFFLPEVASRLEQLGFEPLNLDQKAADTMFRSDIVKWRSMVEAINLKPD